MSDRAEPSSALERLTTGVVGLDLILHGGLERGGLYLVSGEPGAGKTTLGNQLCFHHIRSGGHAVYVTLLTESHSRLFAHLRTMSFFDIDLVGDDLRYYSAYSELDQHGLHGLERFMSHLLRTQKPTLVVLDGFETVKAAAESEIALRRFVHHIHAVGEVINCTIVLLAQPISDAQSPEQTVADGLIELRNRRSAPRSIRELEVRKLRGSSYESGTHNLEITDQGVVVHPRAEAVLRTMPASVESASGRLSVGIPQLDEMLGGGLCRGTSTMVAGTPGAGKTLLSLHFLTAGAQAGEPSVYFGMFERPQRLIEKAQLIGLPFEAAVDQQLIELTWQWPRVDLLDVYAERLLEAIHRRKARRLVIDGVDGFRHVASPERLPGFFTALLEELSALGVTTLYSVQLNQLASPDVELPDFDLAPVTDNMVFLRYVELRSQLYRLLSIAKVRDSQFDTAIHEFSIGANGIDVAATSQSADTILTGVGRVPPTT